MSDDSELTVKTGSESTRRLDAACNALRYMTQARCVMVVVVDGESGSGYSVVGPVDAQMSLPELLLRAAEALRGQLAGSLH